MHALNRKQIACLIGLMALTLTSGCANWRQRYEDLNVEHKNLQGRYGRELSNKKELSDRLAQDQRTIDDLTRQIEDLKRTPAQATGFGEGYDVAFDKSAGTITVTLPNTILFASGKATLKSVTNKDLDHILSVLKSSYAGKMIDVVGHTDSDPIKKSNWKDNWELSAERALAVTRYLVEHGISEASVRAAGCGSSRPIASNASTAGKAKNRRVEIVVHMK